LWALSTLAFFLLRITPGNPFDADSALSLSCYQNLNSHYGLDLPLLQQYTRFMGHLCQGNLGLSMCYAGMPVTPLIMQHFWVSLELALWGLMLAVGLGIALGLWAGLRPQSAVDTLILGLSLLGKCIPNFVLGPLFILFFSLQHHWVDATGWDTASNRLMPVLTLALFYLAYIIRLTRTGVIEASQQPFIRTAKAKGLPEWKVVFVHLLPHAFMPVLSYIAPTLAGLSTGTFVIETVFHIPGLGRIFMSAVTNRDYTLVMGVVLLYGIMLVICNTLCECLIYALYPSTRNRR
jgi:oligopeptide transport system permease protein